MANRTVNTGITFSSRPEIPGPAGHGEHRELHVTSAQPYDTSTAATTIVVAIFAVPIGQALAAAMQHGYRWAVIRCLFCSRCSVMRLLHSDGRVGSTAFFFFRRCRSASVPGSAIQAPPHPTAIMSRLTLFGNQTPGSLATTVKLGRASVTLVFCTTLNAKAGRRRPPVRVLRGRRA